MAGSPVTIEYYKNNGWVGRVRGQIGRKRGRERGRQAGRYIQSNEEIKAVEKRENKIRGDPFMVENK